MPKAPRSRLYIIAVTIVAASALYAEPSVLHSFGWATALVATYFYRLAEEHVAEMMDDLTHFDPTPGPHV